MLTKSQQAVFDFICQFLKENGMPPSYADIGQALGFSSDGTVRTHLEQLEKKGYISRLHHARGIKVLKSQDVGIPIVGKIAAGSPKLTIEDFVGTLADLKELQYQNNRFALTVTGDSMKDAGILDGDLAIIEKEVPIYNGQIAAIMIDGAATLKRVYYEKDRVRLQPENEYYEPIYLDRKSIDAQLIGRYIALVRKA